MDFSEVEYRKSISWGEPVFGLPVRYAIVGSKGNVIDVLNAVCHARVNEHIGKEGVVVTKVDFGNIKEEEAKVGLIEFYRYILNESVVASVFLDKNPTTSLALGFVKSLRVHPSLILIACQLSRLINSDTVRATLLGRCVYHYPNIPKEVLVKIIFGMGLCTTAAGLVRTYYSGGEYLIYQNHHYNNHISEGGISSFKQIRTLGILPPNFDPGDYSSLTWRNQGRLNQSILNSSWVEAESSDREHFKALMSTVFTDEPSDDARRLFYPSSSIGGGSKPPFGENAIRNIRKHQLEMDSKRFQNAKFVNLDVLEKIFVEELGSGQ